MDSDMRRTPNGNQKKRSGRTNEKNLNRRQENNGTKGAKGKGTVSKASVARADSSTVVSDTNLGTEAPEVYEDMVIHYMDDVNRSEETRRNGKTSISASKQNDDENLDENSLDVDKESDQDKEKVSDSDSARDSASSHGEEKVPGASESSPVKGSSKSGAEGLDGKADILHTKVVENTTEKSNKPCGEPSTVSTRSPPDNNLQDMGDPANPSSESSEGVEQKPAQDDKEVDVLDEASNGTLSVGSEDERFDAEKNGVHKDEADLEHKIEEMETRIEKLEEELREVAALEISLYSVVPEHGSSAHKVHTPARHLSRLYIHACKHWTQDRRGTIAKNTASGLILIARSCSNDVPRLNFWLSNTIVLREIISQAFGGSRNSSPFTRFAESNGATTKRSEGKYSTLKTKAASNNMPRNGFMQAVDDWQETGTFIGALGKIESWIFSRIVESVWWQALTPYMQTPDGNSSSSKITGRLLGPALGDQQQGSFSIDLWRTAFQDALHQLCPVRAGGHECGCLPVLARMVMKQCVARLDVAMFNAILRESAHEIPTDPVSDPIVDSKVLPIPAGDLSFGSGAQLKNAVGNWSRWITDAFGMDADDAVKEEHQNENEHWQGGDSDPKSFVLLNELSDLLMLPKDMLMDRSIRKEVCPSISLPLVKRILCNFTPDEFCPDAVPGAVLEALNAESIVERRLSGETTRNFPYTAAAVIYSPPSSADVAKKVAEAGERSPLSRSVSTVQRKGYTSDEELDDLDSPLTSIIDQLQSSPTHVSNGNENGKHVEHGAHSAMNVRYELLREVWSM
ncbi:uncharacterized protein LOC116207775 isoform X2 [Punica granatum]|nr:uncharacterized protein LOC116207775 isoform X2 [Punica granatum]XP_031396729.1 uncharacterized protein LOC116207775 isoform X2 [Punica granatum]OWM67204.1 hypothetical protein CDL15_Pgr000656 [Punica granatum]